MIGTELYTKSYEDFVASLDMQTRDAVTKLMIHTRTRPDDPNMVGVCLTAVATKANAAIQAEVIEAQNTTLQTLEALKQGPDIKHGFERLGAFTSSINQFESMLRYRASLFAILACIVGVCWAGSMLWAWTIGYAVARNDIHAATHEVVCNDINGYIAQISSYWRKTLHLPTAADKLAETAFDDCPR